MLRGKNNSNRDSFPPRDSRGKSKGERLNWVSMKEAKQVKLREAISPGRVVNIPSGIKPRLVP